MLFTAAPQMTSVLDGNVHNLAVSAGSGKPAATFDDCQAIVKQVSAPAGVATTYLLHFERLCVHFEYGPLCSPVRAL